MWIEMIERGTRIEVFTGLISVFQKLVANFAGTRAEVVEEKDETLQFDKWTTEELNYLRQL